MMHNWNIDEFTVDGIIRQTAVIHWKQSDLFSVRVEYKAISDSHKVDNTVLPRISFPTLWDSEWGDHLESQITSRVTINFDYHIQSSWMKYGWNNQCYAICYSISIMKIEEKPTVIITYLTSWELSPTGLSQCWGYSRWLQ